MKELGGTNRLMRLRYLARIAHQCIIFPEQHLKAWNAKKHRYSTNT
jgi:hypothetical protein